MTYRTNFTRSLLAEERQDAVIVASVGPSGVIGEQVVYDPRGRNDSMPWRSLTTGYNHLRFSGRECRAVRPAAQLCGEPLLYGGQVTHCVVEVFNGRHPGRAHTCRHERVGA